MNKTDSLKDEHTNKPANVQTKINRHRYQQTDTRTDQKTKKNQTDTRTETWTGCTDLDMRPEEERRTEPTLFEPSMSASDFFPSSQSESKGSALAKTTGSGGQFM